MLQGTPQFTPKQLLDAARRSETEGKADFAVQFYLHLAEHYGQTPEAVEARTALSRMAATQRPQEQPEGAGLFTFGEGDLQRHGEPRLSPRPCRCLGGLLHQLLDLG